MNEVIKEIEHDDNCIWNYIGSIIGGLIGAIPWIIIYYYYSVNIPIFPVLIPIFSVYGYKFFKGIFNYKSFKIISILSILIFFISIYFLFPYIISEKNDMNFNEFRNSRYNKIYIKEIKNNINVEILFLIVGLVISKINISKFLSRYKATNNMIKDTNTFIRDDNKPIDSDDNGIMFLGEKNPVKTKFEFGNKFNLK